MAGVEQATAPDEQPRSRASRRAGRRAGRKSGQKSDAQQQVQPAHADDEASDETNAVTDSGSVTTDDEPTSDKAAHRAAEQTDDGTDAEPDEKPRSPAARDTAPESAPEPARGATAEPAHGAGPESGPEAPEPAHEAEPMPVRATAGSDLEPAGTTPGTDREPAGATAGIDLEPADTAPGTALEPVRTARGVKPSHTAPAHSGAPVYRPRHAKRRRSRWPVLLAAGLVLVALAGSGTAFLLSQQDGRTDDAVAPVATRVAPAPANLPTAAGSVTPTAAAPPAAAPGTAACRFNTAPDKSPKIVPPGKATRSGIVKATIGTNRGPITLNLDATNAPCAVESFLTLATGGYFTDTACHRLTTSLIFVLQCGDPTATGSGDPGYSFDDENLPAPGGTPYPRGTLAMANAGPDTNGSQFFIVYKDSPIDPNYPVFGTITGGMEIVDQVAAGGAPNNDGQPNSSLVIQAVQLS